MNILIVGAGPTGLTAAIELYRRGFKPRLVDRKPQPSPLSRAVGINPRSLELLEASGATQKLLETGLKMPDVTMYENGTKLVTMRLSLLPPPYNFLLCLPQDSTEHILNDVLAGYGGEVEYGRTLTSLTQNENDVEVTFYETETQRYDYVIAADGAHSFIRNTLNIDFPGHDYTTRWSIADFDSPWPGHGDLFLMPGGQMRFMVQIGPHRFRAVSNEPEAIKGLPANVPIDQIHHANDFVISVRQAVTYQQGRVFLAGDAAHVHSPAGGRGMNLGIEDACDLAARLASPDRENLLPSYTKARHPSGLKAIKLSERLVKMATQRSPVGRTLRHVVMGLMDRHPSLQKPMLRSFSGRG